MRRLYCLFALLFIAAYIVASRVDWFTEAMKSHVARNPLFFDDLDLRKKGTVTWNVPKERWVYKKGKAQLSLVLNLETLREIPRGRTQVELRLKVAAYGVQPDGKRQDRLIKDWYFTTDEPFSKAGESLWESWGYGHCAFGLGAVEIQPGEDTTIEVQIMIPDGKLALGNPRLKLVGDHDYAAVPLEMLFLGLLRDGGCVIALLLLLGLFVLAWRRSTQPFPEKVTDSGGTR